MNLREEERKGFRIARRSDYPFGTLEKMIGGVIWCAAICYYPCTALELTNHWNLSGFIIIFQIY